jgi:Transglycosylase SLT domain
MPDVASPDELVPSVAPAPGQTRDIGVQTPPAAFGVGVGQATEQAGNSAVDVALQRQQIINEKANVDAENNLTNGIDNYLYNPQSGYLVKKGDNAVNGYQDAHSQINDLFAQTRQGLSNDAQRRMFDVIGQRVLRYGLETAGRHAQQQQDVATNDSLTGALTTAVQSGGLNWNDDHQFGSKLSNIDDAVNKMGVFNGWDENKIEAERLKWHSEAWSARIRTAAATDPGSALKMMDQASGEIDDSHRAQLDLFLRPRAEALAGQNNASQAIREVAGGTSNATAAGPVSGDYKTRVAELEGGNNPAAVNPGSGAFGLYQFMPATARGLGVSPQSSPQEIDSAMDRFTAQNKSALTSALGRSPSDPEMYVAHAEGAEGAALLLKNPAAPAVDALAPAYGGNLQQAAAAVKGVGGNENMSAGDLTTMLQDRYAGKAGAGAFKGDVDSMEASAIQRAIQLSNGNVNLERTSVGAVKEQFQAIRMESAARQAQATAQQEQMANQYFSMATSDQFAADPQAITKFRQMLSEDTSSGAMDWKTSRDLLDFAEKNQRTSTDHDLKAYGPGFSSALSKINLPASDPDRITSIRQLIPMGGDAGQLTADGITKLNDILKATTRPEGQSDAKVQESLLKYAQHQLSFQDPDAEFSMKDPHGMDTYNVGFVPAFYKAWDAASSAGKDPKEIFTKDGIDKMLAPYKRSDAQYMADYNAASGFNPQAGDAVDLTSGPGIVAAFNAGKITREQAEAAALQHGFMKPAQAAAQVPIAQ